MGEEGEGGDGCRMMGVAALGGGVRPERVTTEGGRKADGVPKNVRSGAERAGRQGERRCGGEKQVDGGGRRFEER